ncbi:hypothetical protein [Kushneria phosphatilytica]|uniref:VRR-NUC domain-containing protein n=1 Tax=Kushneria phosphatilytica TaxID=657387 RepID=A0A1S1NXF5_9GAMM|nr:hypothetical protein [Kushneria phosphatilytica]OHV12148.1 hypothetical protein BH688_05705 [Kushneria phosphatilytica]QEL11340.1 VRR-NUC domain-containing protein [Kushneria phosphatilytica]
MPQEIDIETAFVRHVRRRGYEALKLVLASQRGWPDRTCPLPGGRICYIELKHPDGTGRESAQQRKTRTWLEARGHPVLVTDDLETAKMWFDEQLEIARAL